tara:strand:- start:4021 stop:4296 length:276 start_codon:yes stop_codon:yes gene_type:complete
MEDNNKYTDNLLSILDNLINKAMENTFSAEANEGSLPFQNPEDYRKATGKRFRMTKEQKNSGMSRQEAFEVFISNWSPDPDTYDRHSDGEN